MKYFVTGASGFIGSAVTAELVKAGHEVVALARSDASAQAVSALGAQVLRGDLDDVAALQQGASSCDGVAHCAFIHDFANYDASCKADRRAILAMTAVLKGTSKPIVASFGTLFLPNQRPATEEDKQPEDGFATERVKTEKALLDEAANGVAAMALRLPPTVHGKGDRAFIPAVVAAAQAHSRSAYVNEGTNHWPAVHRLDAARLYRLALENPVAGKVLHAIQEQGIPFKDIASVIAKQLSLPLVSLPPGPEADAHFGFLGVLVNVDNPVSSEATQKTFGWTPNQPGLLEDLASDHYYTPGTGTIFQS